MVYKTAYDLDGVLAVQPPPSPKKWGRMKGPERIAYKIWLVDYYRNAPTLFNPPEKEFLVITARKNTPEIREATEAWLKRHLHGKTWELHMLDVSRSIDAVLAFKSKILKDHAILDYTEDNRKVVSGLRAMKIACRIWHFKKGQQILDYDFPIEIGN